MPDERRMTEISDRPPDGSASSRILQAAVDLFKVRGYHGTSMRELARAADIESASIYYHFDSKQQILLHLFSHIMDDLLEGLDRSIASGRTAEEQLRAFVRFHVLYHISRQDEAFISHMELRSLTGKNLDNIIAKRDEYERKVRGMLAQGVQEGCFDIADIRMTSTALLMMCSGVSDWFASSGRLSSDEVADRYFELAVKLLT